MKPIRAIVTALDFSGSSNFAFHTAIDLARRFGAELHLFHALEVAAPLFNPYALSDRAALVKAARDAATRRLEKLCQTAGAAGVVVKLHLGKGPAAAAIADRATRLGADLIVIGTRGNTGFKHILLGSVAEHTVREAPCTVLTVKRRDFGVKQTVEKILAAVDFSEHGDRALDAAVEFAKQFNAKLHIVHALEPWVPVMIPYEVAIPTLFLEEARDAAVSRLDALVQKVAAEGVVPTSHLAEAPAALGIVELAEKIGTDLIVIGTRGHTGLKQVLLGSVAERTLRHAPCSVLTVKAASR